ncbi:hypothetical protein DA2_2221 [Desulfovibrio sp. A2]|nr:hypothetical protein DA2_2221 [Desulfovibrio sp. A2]
MPPAPPGWHARAFPRGHGRYGRRPWPNVQSGVFPLPRASSMLPARRARRAPALGV